VTAAIGGGERNGYFIGRIGHIQHFTLVLNDKIFFEKEPNIGNIKIKFSAKFTQYCAKYAQNEKIFKLDSIIKKSFKHMSQIVAEWPYNINVCLLRGY
jgi:hypothetical protein